MVVTPLRFFPKNLLHFRFTLQDGKIFGSIAYENPTVLSLLDFKNSEAQVVLPQLPHDPYFGVEFWVSTCGNEWSPVFIAGGRHGGLTSRWEGR